MSSADLCARLIDMLTSDMPEILVVLGSVAGIRLVFRMFVMGAVSGRLNV